MFYKKILLYFSFFTLVFSQDNIQFRSVIEKDILFTPYKEEGYLQGWNFYFLNSEHSIILTFVVSNLGPFDLNNGVSISIDSIKMGEVFKTKEFAEKDLEANKNQTNLKFYNNTLVKSGSIYKINQFYDDIKIYLEFYSDEKGVTLSGGNSSLSSDGKFVRADIVTSFVKAKGYIDYKGEIIDLEGVGGMEHLITNYEIYKFSSRWEILRANNESYKIFSGGYYGKKKDTNDFFRTLVLLDNKGKILLSGKILRSEVLQSSVESLSKYQVPDLEKIYLTENCTVEIKRGKLIGRGNILANVSKLLRFFINLFFTNPYLVSYKNTIKVDCPEKLEKSIPSFNGIHTYYLINSK